MPEPAENAELTVTAEEAKAPDVVENEQESSPSVEEEYQQELDALPGEHTVETDPDATATQDSEPAAEGDGEQASFDPDSVGLAEIREAYKNLRSEKKSLQERLSSTEPVQTSQDPGPAFKIDLNSDIGFVKADPASYQSPGVTTAEAAQSSGPTEERATPEFAFETLAKINAGEADDSYRGSAIETISEYSPQEILKVLERSKSNGFGEYSDDVKSLAIEALTEANATYEVRKEEDRRTQEIMEQRRLSLDVVRAVDGITETDSEVRKLYESTALELNEKIPGYYEIYARAPEMALWIMNLKGNSASADNVKALREENETLKKELQSLKGPAPLGLPGTGDVEKTAEQDFATEMAALGI